MHSCRDQIPSSHVKNAWSDALSDPNEGIPERHGQRKAKLRNESAMGKSDAMDAIL
jgi:hypothetical protein